MANEPTDDEIRDDALEAYASSPMVKKIRVDGIELEQWPHAIDEVERRAEIAAGNRPIAASIDLSGF